MGQTKELTEARMREIGARITQLRVARGLMLAEVGRRLGDSEDAIRKLETGRGTSHYAKLCELAEALQATPNDILGFAPPSERELFIGVLEGCLMGNGMTLAEAQSVAEAALEVLDSPEVADEGVPPRNIARVLARVVMRKFFAATPDQTRGSPAVQDAGQ